MAGLLACSNLPFCSQNFTTLRLPTSSSFRANPLIPSALSMVSGDEGAETGQQEDKLGGLKRRLVGAFRGTEYGTRTTREGRAEITELIYRLEAENPTPAPTEAPELLHGNWILLYTAFSELMPVLAVGRTPFLKIKKITEEIDTKRFIVLNDMIFSNPFITFSISSSTSFEVQSPLRIQVQPFKEGTFHPMEIFARGHLPKTINILGQKIDLVPILQSHSDPLEESSTHNAHVLSRKSDFKFMMPGSRVASWLLTTYLDEDLRISRGDGGLFVLVKEGNPLLNQLT